MSQKTPCNWSRRVPHCGGSGKATYAHILCAFHTVLSALSNITLPSGQKPSSITLTLPVSCNLFPTAVQGLFAHPVLSYGMLSVSFKLIYFTRSWHSPNLDHLPFVRKVPDFSTRSSFGHLYCFLKVHFRVIRTLQCHEPRNLPSYLSC